jgi:hypothetical protein
MVIAVSLSRIRLSQPFTQLRRDGIQNAAQTFTEIVNDSTKARVERMCLWLGEPRLQSYG